MDDIFVTSDLHFYHKRILEFCPETRPYKDVDQMNEIMCQEWNNTVRPSDTVFILGDVALNVSVQDIVRYMKRLNGNKHLVIGNHDVSYLKHDIFKELFISIEHYKEFKIGKKVFVMFHYPIYEWHHCFSKNVYHLYGHVHGRKMPHLEPYQAMDVSWDANGKILSYDNIMKYMENKVPMKRL